MDDTTGADVAPAAPAPESASRSGAAAAGRTTDASPSAPGAAVADRMPDAAPAAPDLRPLGLAPGDRVRWRDRRSSRWREGAVTGRERDGSIGVRDARGASRALRPERLEVRGRGPRGGVVWEPVPERAARTEQLGLWETAAEGDDLARDRPR